MVYSKVSYQYNSVHAHLNYPGLFVNKIESDLCFDNGESQRKNVQDFEIEILIYLL